MSSKFHAVREIGELIPSEIELLTQLLSLPTTNALTPDWLEGQAQCISTFPPALLKVSSLLPRLTSLPSEKPTLCKSHKPLNPHLIRDLFRAVTAECTSHQARLEPREQLPESLQIFLNCLQKANSLWLSPLIYAQTFITSPIDPRYERIASRCEACILAAVGGNRQLVADLRTAILGRKKPRRPADPLLAFVDGWLDWTGCWDEVREQSGVVVKEIRRFRRHNQKIRRQSRRTVQPHSDSVSIDSGRSSSLVTQESGVEADQEGDTVDDIVQFYSKRMSRDTVRRSSAAEGIHPAFRDSIVFCAETGTFRHKFNAKPSSPVKSAFGQDDLSDKSQNNHESLELANFYRDLIDAEEIEEEIKASEKEDEDFGGLRCVEGEEMRASRWGERNFF